MFELSEKKQEILTAQSHLIIIGGPGSGKTTIALLKAQKEAQSGFLDENQKILFLSFARSTVARVQERLVEFKGSKLYGDKIEITTYHGFFWELLRSHGYLICPFKKIRLLQPQEASSRLVEFVDENKEIEKIRLFNEEGLLHFDLFARKSQELLANSKALAHIICNTFPLIILDEFQDTNKDEWEIIKILGQKSRIIALADINQRIYEFRGADPLRIKDFLKEFSPQQFDFEIENNRSAGTDIVDYGNDLLSGTNKSKAYNNVKIITYPIAGEHTNQKIKAEVLSAIQRLNKEKSKWTLAVLFPSKSLMMNVSSYLSKNQRFANGKSLPQIYHDVSIEKDALALSAIIISSLIEQGDVELEMINKLIAHLINYIRGKNGGNKISQNDLKLSKALLAFLETGKIKGSSRRGVVEACGVISRKCSELKFTGEPAEDWIKVRDILSKSSNEIFQNVAQDAMFLRLLHKGSTLQSGLSELWRTKNNYVGAVNLVRNALLQEHFSTIKKLPRGVLLMTIHKSKGKEFDEVIIYDGTFSGKIVRDTSKEKEIQKSRILLRVGVTRAISRCSILTPERDRCILV